MRVLSTIYSFFLINLTVKYLNSAFVRILRVILFETAISWNVQFQELWLCSLQSRVWGIHLALFSKHLSKWLNVPSCQEEIVEHQQAIDPLSNLSFKSPIKFFSLKQNITICQMLCHQESDSAIYAFLLHYKSKLPVKSMEF